MNIVFLLTLLSYSMFLATEEITPYKFTDQEIQKLVYKIPESCRFTTKRLSKDNSDIIYYLSKPKTLNYPIAICCGGSSSRNRLVSIIHFHRYFLQEFLDLGIAVLTVEQQGIDGNQINEQEFWQHYTRSARLQDYQAVIEKLKLNSPVGWNGKIILFGVSEGGPIVTTLTQQYCDITIATMNWSGAGDWSWRDEVWLFIDYLKTNGPWWFSWLGCIQKWIPSIPYVPVNRLDYDRYIDEIVANPTTNKDFLGMTYAYHVDALCNWQIEYEKIKTPFLVVAGALDIGIASCDAFVQKATIAGVPITYLRIEDMDHYVRKRPDVIEVSFQWLSNQLN
ncbi:alpha/beta hydrolase [Candidatus Babeliales bacterium]|nr:alpha/beta hydrolase [Candidatus Babeliales bacterium]